MKTLVKMLVALMISFFMTSCGGGGGWDSDPINGGSNGYGTTIYVDSLYDGYKIEGTSSYGEDVTLFFYSNGTYQYYRDNEYFEGTYQTDDYNVIMSDYTDDGSYILEGDSYGQFTEGGSYSCPGLGRRLNIYTITRI